MNYATMKMKETATQLPGRPLPNIGNSLEKIVHDFNNILLGILGHTHMALWSIRQECHARNQLRHVLKASRRAQELVQQILCTNCTSEQERKLVTMHWLVDEVLDLLRPSLPSNIRITTDLDCPSSTILADPTQMYRVLLNIFTNAGHAMKENGGVLTVELRQVIVTDVLIRRCPTLELGPHLCLTVTDTGKGMMAEIKDRIFEPLFTSKPIGEGKGLGLGVVDTIITNHQGGIIVESAPDKGTRFEIYLPSYSDVCETPYENMV